LRIKPFGVDRLAVRDVRWSKAIAIGSLAFAEKVKRELGIKAMHREVEQARGTYEGAFRVESLCLTFAALTNEIYVLLAFRNSSADISLISD
jgi:hypothetical protein